MLRHLVTADGSALAHDSALESSGVPDGAVLRLVRAEDAPSAPVVHDITDEAPTIWRYVPAVAARRVTAGATTVVWALVTGMLAGSEFTPSTVGKALFGTAAGAALAGAQLGRARRLGLAAILIVTAGSLGVLGTWTLGAGRARHYWRAPQ